MELTTDERQKVLTAYNDGDQKLKSKFAEIFGMQLFIYPSEDIRKRFEAACKNQGKDPNILLHSGPQLDIEQIVANAYTMLRILAKEKRGTYEPNWTDGKSKYTPWPRYEPGVGFVVGDTDYGLTYTYTLFGSRLCFPTWEMAVEFGQENIELYRITHSN